MALYYVDLDGEKVSVSEYCRRKGISYSALMSRKSTLGLSLEEVISQYENGEVKEWQHFLDMDGEKISVSEYCKRKGLSISAVYTRKNRKNETFEEAIDFFESGNTGKPKVNIDGELVSITEACKRKNLSYSAVTSYKYNNDSITWEEAIDHIENRVIDTKIEVNGEIVSIKEACRIYGISYRAVVNKKCSANISYEEAIAIYVNGEGGHKRIMVTIDGKEIALQDYCKENNFNFSTVKSYIYTHPNLSKEEILFMYKNGDIGEGTSYLVELDGEKICVKEYCKRKGISYGAVMTRRRKINESYEDTLAYFENRRVSKSRHLYTKWHSMMDRCYNPNCPEYKNYGGRGIKVQESWHNYFNFEDDVYEEYIEYVEQYGKRKTTIDRIDVDGNYEYNNIRWATPKEQQNNKRNTIRLANGEPLTYACKRLGINYHTTYNKMYKNNLTPDEAVADVLKSRK